MGEVRADPARAGSYRVSGELDFETVPGLLEQGQAMFEAAAPALRLDLQGVTRADSAGLALLVEWLKAARRRDREIAFVNVPEQLLAMARVSGLEEVLPFGDPARERREGV